MSPLRPAPAAMGVTTHPDERRHAYDSKVPGLTCLRRAILLRVLLLHTVLGKLQAVVLLHAWLLEHALWYKGAARLRDPSMRAMQAGRLLWQLLCQGTQALRMLPRRLPLLQPLLHLQGHWGPPLGQGHALLLPETWLLLQLRAKP